MNCGLRVRFAVRISSCAILVALLVDTVASQAQTGNTATGFDALFSNTTGSYDTATGYKTLYSNNTGSYNTATGLGALYSNTSGTQNTAMGSSALYYNTTGSYNTATGLDALLSNTTGNFNTANGYQTLYYNTTGSQNTANGYTALFSNTTGNYNTANGYEALYEATGSYNTANGYSALMSNTTGNNNTADGYDALVSAGGSTSNDTAVGYQARYTGILNSNNTAVGCEAFSPYNEIGQGGSTATGYFALTPTFSAPLGWNTPPGMNDTGCTAYGYEALSNYMGPGSLMSTSQTAGQNTASGYQALYDYYMVLGANSSSDYYEAFFTGCATASGYQALYNGGIVGDTAIGCQALYSYGNGGSGGPLGDINANGNVANGYQALYLDNGGKFNTAVGWEALANIVYGTSTTYGNVPQNNIGLGADAGFNLTTSNYNIDIGNAGVAAENATIRIGASGSQTATYIAGIYGTTVSGAGLTVNSNGQLGAIVSSRRFKHDIKNIGNISDKLMDLRPVTFRYNDTAEKGPHALQYGLIAEEVAKVYPDLVQYDKAGKPFSVYYHLLTPMLLNEFQKEHRRNNAQEAELMAMKAAHNAEITALKSELASLKQSHEHRHKILAKLAAYMQTAQSNEPIRNVVPQ